MYFEYFFVNEVKKARLIKLDSLLKTEFYCAKIKIAKRLYKNNIEYYKGEEGCLQY